MTEAKASLVANRRYQEKMPRLRMDVGTILKIKLNPIGHTASRTFQGEYIGVVHYKFIVIRLPSVPGLINILLPKTIVEVQYQTDGSVHSFFAEVEGHATRPAFLLFASYPDRLTILDIREHNRVACTLPCVMHSPQGIINGMIADLSIGGCRMVIPRTGNPNVKEVVAGATLVLTTSLNPAGSPVPVTATVRSVEPVGPCLSCGMVFSNTPEFVVDLGNYLQLLKDVSSE